MRMEKYCNETAQHETQTGAFDGQSKPVYNAPVTIACRKEAKAKLIKDADGREFLTTSRYFTPTQVQKGDRLDGERVESAEQYKGRTGTIDGYECYV